MLHEEITIKQRIMGVSVTCREERNIGEAEGKEEDSRKGREIRTKYNTCVKIL